MTAPVRRAGALDRAGPGSPAGVRVRRAVLADLGLGTPAVAPDGSLRLATFAVARQVAARLAEERPAAREAASAGGLAAMGLLDEILRRMTALYRERVRPDAFEAALDALRAELGQPAVEGVLDGVRDEFHPAGAAPPVPSAPTLEDLLLVWLANANPALAPFRVLVDARPLARGRAYQQAVEALDRAFRRLPPFGPDRQSLVDLLRAPALASPDSLGGQLRFIRERWADLIGDLLDRLLVHLDVLVEEEVATWRRFHPGGGGGGTEGAAALGAALGGLAGEPERFSADSAWMPRVVLMAKSTYVWLDQLARRFGREVRRLDQVPDEALDELASWGVTGLWLIGLWQRSRASERIKRMRGNPEAAASAYSLDDYRIADDLGGELACANLRDRAWARGIRLASDMVPNHMGIDSRWVVEHPERFLSLPEPPYPGYRFSGEDLSPDDRVEIRIEDHYWDGSDAAVVFERRDPTTGERRYIYHGNDGTSFPWNDTAQLDYLDPATREAVIGAILDVARRFPIIRFDAAMTLARRHIRRLWFPEPGAGGAIPSRAEHGLSAAEFDAAMPTEFWRDVVDRVAAEVPGTLLLAEAFWLMEGYFVRTLGMHRVYNSAFMHMLRDEDNAGYRRVMRDTLEFDPEILKRYVNFMSNPDEATAVEQFGKGDKYFGVATLLATLPGLPMLGHGQVEGYAEKYGMEYRRAYRDETPDAGLIEHHARTIFPLLHRRAQFAEVRDFLLYDVVADDGSLLEDVFAYSNVGPGGERSLVLYHNRFASAAGWLRESVGFSVPDGRARGGRRVVRRTLADGWRLPAGDDALVAWRDHVTGLEHLAPAGALRARGLRVELGAYERRVLLDVRDVRDGPAGLWRRLAGRLGGRGVPSLEDALRELALDPVHAALREAVGGPIAALAASGTLAIVPSPEDALAALAARVVEAAGLPGPAAATAAYVDAASERLAAIGRAARQAAAGDAHRGHARAVPAAAPAPVPPAVAVRPAFADPWHRAVLAAWSAVEPLGRLAPGAPAGPTSRAWFDELRLDAPLAAGLHGAGLDEADAWRAAERVRVLLALPRPSNVGGRGPRETARRLAEAWLAHPDVRPFIRVNTWDAVEWFGREQWRELLDWALLLDLVELVPDAAERSGAVVATLLDAGERSGYRLDRLRTVLRPARGRPGQERRTPER